MRAIKKTIIYLIFLANLAVILFIWWAGSSSLLLSSQASSVLIALGRITGLLAEYLILVQLVLIGRISWIEQLYGHDQLNIFHRGNGYFLSVFILLHPLLLVFGYSYLNNVSLWGQFLDFVNNWNYVLLAFMGIFFFVIAVSISMPSIKNKLKFETWYFTHLVMYLFIGLIFTHQIQTADVSFGWQYKYWLILNFAIFGIMLSFRFGRPLYRFLHHGFYVEKVVDETPSTYSIYIGGRNLDKFKFKAGHHANFTFLAKGLWYTHPFSFSMLPNDKSIRITIKKLGDFTTPLAMVPIGTKVFIDGPLGLFIEDVAKKDKFLLLAGGVGITPIRALIESIESKQGDVVLLYGNRTVNDVIFGEELSKLKSTTHFIFSDQKVKDLEFGRIDEEKIKRLVPDFAEREIYVCGPPPMLQGLLKTFKKLEVPSSQIHTEIF